MRLGEGRHLRQALQLCPYKPICDDSPRVAIAAHRRLGAFSDAADNYGKDALHSGHNSVTSYISAKKTLGRTEGDPIYKNAMSSLAELASHPLYTIGAEVSDIAFHIRACLQGN